LERSKSLVLLQGGGFDVPLATVLCKTFLLRMLNDSRAGRNPLGLQSRLKKKKKKKARYSAVLSHPAFH
jgi:hypothetical protein